MNTTIILVCYETQPLIRTAYESIRAIYPDIKVIVVDGSRHRSDCHYYTSTIKSKDTDVYQVHYNIGHGDGMNFAMKHVQTKYALLMDSDVIINRECIISMECIMNESWIDLYGCGLVISVNNKGINDPNGFAYLHPHFAMVNRDTYRKYDPAAHHGAPMIQPMRQIRDRKESHLLKYFPVSDYVTHKGRGTVNTVRRSQYTKGWVK